MLLFVRYEFFVKAVGETGHPPISNGLERILGRVYLPPR